MSAKIIYTLTDEAPLLATYSLLPIVKAYDIVVLFQGPRSRFKRCWMLIYFPSASKCCRSLTQKCFHRLMFLIK